jgi:hypothetical protein
MAMPSREMCRPAGVSDSQVAFDRAVAQRILEHPNLADRTHPAQVAGAVQYGDAGGVVTPVLEASQAFDQDGNDVAIRDRADDSAHGQLGFL